jgi:hypothetical protein
MASGLLGVGALALSRLVWELDSRVLGGRPVTTAQWVALGLLGLGIGLVALSLIDSWRARKQGHEPWFLALLEPASPRTYRLLALGSGATVALAIAALASMLGPHFPIDDAYITLRNAEFTRSLVDPVFGAAHPWTGSTSVLHTALVFLAGRVVPGPWASWVVGGLSAIAYATGIVRLAVAGRAPAAITFLALVVGLLGGLTPFQLANGMETGLAMATTTWALALALDPRPAWGLPVLAGAMPFVRPELAALAVPLLAVWTSVEAGRRPDAGPGLVAARGVALLVAAAAPLAAVSFVQTGMVIPATVAAKAAWFSEGCAPVGDRTSTVLRALRTQWNAMGPAALVSAFLPTSAVGLAALAFVASTLGAFWWFLPGGLFHNDYRYMAVFTPVVLLGGVLACRFGSAMRALVLVVLTWGAVHAIENADLAIRHLAEAVAFTRTELVPLASWVDASTPADSVLLVHDVGFIGRAAHRRMVDVVGLKSPPSSEVHGRVTAPHCGRDRSKAISEIARGAGATHLVVLDGWERIYGIAEGLRKEGWRLTPLREGAYRVYRMEPPPRPD